MTNKTTKEADQKQNESTVGDQLFMEDLQVSLVDIYNSRLQERKRRKKLIRGYGLLNQDGTRLWQLKYQAAIGKLHFKKMLRFCHLITAEEADHLFTSLECLNEKRSQENKYIFYRSQRGITSKNGIEMFEMERKMSRINYERVNIRCLAEPPKARKKKATNKSIFHLPRYRELSAEEAELCSSIGIVPQFYLNTKDALATDCKRNDGMLLKRARQMVKIDVNKTRKIFDLLMEQGHLWAHGGRTQPVKKS